MKSWSSGDISALAENPLLPNAELQALHALLKRATRTEAAAVRKAAKVGTPGRRVKHVPSREAILAGTLLQLRGGDIFLSDPGDTVSPSLLPSADEEGSQIAAPVLPGGAPQLMLAAGMAAAVKAASGEHLVLALSRAEQSEAGWPQALAWAQEQQLPLVVAIADPSGANAFRPSLKTSPAALSWTAVQKTASRLKLPVLTVDGEDAVAMYRVMQESALRARSGGGPAILWAMLPSARELSAGRPASSLPLRRLHRYLRTRGISV